MGILSGLLTLPVSAPVKGSLWVARKVHETAEKQFTDPSAIRAELGRLERALLAGEITENYYDEAEMELLLRLQGAPK